MTYRTYLPPAEVLSIQNNTESIPVCKTETISDGFAKKSGKRNRKKHHAGVVLIEPNEGTGVTPVVLWTALEASAALPSLRGVSAACCCRTLPPPPQIKDAATCQQGESNTMERSAFARGAGMGVRVLALLLVAHVPYASSIFHHAGHMQTAQQVLHKPQTLNRVPVLNP
jgi:hypothetical protein